MDLKRLQFLVRVIETGSITRAAAALHIAQPALSQHIQVLERSAGAVLLIRSKDGVTPTQAGMIAYRNAKILARQLDRARMEVRSLASAPGGRVTVGLAPHSHARGLIQPLLKEAATRYPEILLHISENFEGVLAEDLRMGRMDMALLFEIAPIPGSHSERISTEILCMVGRWDLLGSGALSSKTPLLLPSAAHAIRQIVEAVYTRRRIRPSVVAEIESFETLSAAVAEGLGATILPHSVATRLADQAGLSVRPFDMPPTSITLSLATAGIEDMSEAAQAIHRLLVELAVRDVAQSHGAALNPGP